MRYFIRLSYNGARYSGWQVQPGAHTIQQQVEAALQMLLGPTTAGCTASGRTDAGVHATGQVVHMDAKPGLEAGDFLYRLNAILPEDIAAHSIRGVRPDAHARYDALRRSYEYHIHRQKDPFKSGRSYFFTPELDIDAMNEAAEWMLRWKDYQSFSRVKTDVKHFDCEIFEAVWRKENDCLIFCVIANRFLRGMVRATVGTLLEIGRGRLNQNDFRVILESRDRRQAARNVPPEGLFLTNITFSEEIYILF